MSQIPIFLKNLVTGVTTPTSLEVEDLSDGYDIRLDKSEKTAEYWDTKDSEGKALDAFPTFDADKQELKYIVTNLTGAWTYTQHNHIDDDDSYLCISYPKTKADEDIDPIVIGYKVVAKIPILYYARVKDTPRTYKVVDTQYASPNTITALLDTITIDGASVSVEVSEMGTPIAEVTDDDGDVSGYTVRVGKSPIRVRINKTVEEDGTGVEDDGGSTSDADSRTLLTTAF